MNIIEKQKAGVLRDLLLKSVALCAASQFFHPIAFRRVPPVTDLQEVGEDRVGEDEGWNPESDMDIDEIGLCLALALALAE
ncbi:Hypothetical predicted protein [Olea europaea subsp. europaea]|uniref:Uncharacterized protein n=1 Tax=Olea europaea subsp. europaea TaxID=158383 RepID=A0A8S0T8K3_OLEEU|nr:Hypothetical predicted protein [Olea europaea subsp. europaea]